MPRKSRVKHFIVILSGSWSIHAATNKRLVKSHHISEYGRGTDYSIRVATAAEIEQYIEMFGSIETII